MVRLLSSTDRLCRDLNICSCNAVMGAESKEAAPFSSAAPDPEAARRAAMLSTLAIADESRPGTLDRILRQASISCHFHAPDFLLKVHLYELRPPSPCYVQYDVMHRREQLCRRSSCKIPSCSSHAQHRESAAKHPIWIGKYIMNDHVNQLSCT